MRPRPILPNRTYLITRRTTQQLFLLRPSPEINACIRYCLALAQRRSGLKIHAIIFMSNHYHLVVTDVHGTLPVFTEELNKLIARSLNCHHDRGENFWAGSAQTSHVELISSEDVLDKVVYTLANPTEAHLVSHGSQWPGVRLFRKGGYLAKKPRFLFRSKEAGGALPDTLDLQLTPPPIGVHENAADDVIKSAAGAREKRIRQEAKVLGKRFLGASGVLKQSIYNSPTVRVPRRGISPSIACKDKWRRIEALASSSAFRRDHKEARKSFMAGVRDVLFPVGTYRFVRQFGACCAEA